MATYDHGIASTEAGTYGLYQSWESEDTVDIPTAQDADGDVADYAVVNRSITVNIELILDTTKTPPAAGTTLALTGDPLGGTKQVVIRRVRASTVMDNFRRLSLEGIRWPTNSIPN